MNKPLTRKQLAEQVLELAAYVAGMADSYQKYAKRHSSVGKAQVDPLFLTRNRDYQKASEQATQYAREANNLLKGNHEETFC